MTAPTYASSVTAVGRLLRPRGSEPRVHRVLAVSPAGTVRRVTDQPLQDGKPEDSEPAG